MNAAELAKRVNLVGPWLRERFGGKVAKLGLDPGFGCPHKRAGAQGGCLFCPPSGAGRDQGGIPIARQIESGIERLSAAARRNGKPTPRLLAYYQAYTGTNAAPKALEQMLAPALKHPMLEGIIVSTRPDCLDEERLEVLSRAAEEKFFWLELGLQSAHDETLRLINRGHDAQSFSAAARLAHGAGIKLVAHVILGLPGEDKAMALATADYLAGLGVWGVKMHTLMVLEQTGLAVLYNRGKFEPWSLDKWAETAAEFLARLPQETLIHRLVADPGRDKLLAPDWAADKNRALARLLENMTAQDIRQGGLPPCKP